MFRLRTLAQREHGVGTRAVTLSTYNDDELHSLRNCLHRFLDRWAEGDPYGWDYVTAFIVYPQITGWYVAIMWEQESRKGKQYLRQQGQQSHKTPLT